MELKSGYKQTDIGVIPIDWQDRSIKSVAKLINGRGFKPFEWKNDGLPIIRIQNLNGSDEFNYFQGSYDKKLEIENGQLLFAWSGSRGTSFGPHVWKGTKGLLNYHTWKVVVNENEVQKKFFLHALKQLTKFIEDKAHGASALVHTQKWEMEGFKFPMPSSEFEQTAIANALSDADALIGSLQKLIAKKRQIKQGAMQTLLNPYENGVLKAGRVKKTLGDIGQFRGGSGFPTKYQGLKEGDYPFYKVSDMNSDGNELFMSASNHYISENIRKEISANPFRQNTIVFAKIGAAIFLERKKILSKSSCIDNNMMGFVFDENSYDVRYLHYLFLTIKLGNLVSTTALPSLSGKEIAELFFYIPAKEEQSSISKVLSDMDTEIVALESKLTKYQNIKQGMMQNLLTGRIRLV